MKLSESFFSIAFIDLDGFKKVNDDHGHTKGDFVLIEIAKIIKNNLENHDFVSRIGGDEFIIVFFDPEIDHIKEKLEKIKDNIEVNMIKLDLDVTASIGLVTYNKEPENFDAIIKFSDEKMYEAKKAGKNVIVCDFF